MIFSYPLWMFPSTPPQPLLRPVFSFPWLFHLKVRLENTFDYSYLHIIHCTAVQLVVFMCRPPSLTTTSTLLHVEGGPLPGRFAFYRRRVSVEVMQVLSSSWISSGGDVKRTSSLCVFHPDTFIVLKRGFLSHSWKIMRRQLYEV